MTMCNCGSDIPFQNCCEPYLLGVSLPSSPEALMRSRFTAYARNDMQYVLDTYSASQRISLSVNLLTESAANTKWTKLRVHKAETIGDKGIVEFTAFYLERKHMGRLHETSQFVKEMDKWVYDKGDIHDDSGLQKVTRNDACLCGSGKKFKACCGKRL